MLPGSGARDVLPVEVALSLSQQKTQIGLFFTPFVTAHSVDIDQVICVVANSCRLASARFLWRKRALLSLTISSAVVIAEVPPDRPAVLRGRSTPLLPENLLLQLLLHRHRFAVPLASNPESSVPCSTKCPHFQHGSYDAGTRTR